MSALESSEEYIALLDCSTAAHAARKKSVNAAAA
jgi:hypothetical protein